MKIILQSLKKDFPAPPLTYLMQRLAAFQLTGISKSDFEQAYKKYGSSRIPVVPAEQLPKLTDSESAAIDNAITCARRELATNYNLLPGEQIGSEFFSYLSSPFEDISAGTPVLRQETNFAVTYFFFDNTRIDGTRLVSVPPAKVLPPATQAGPVVGGVALDLALELAKGLLSGIGEKIGALICDEIFDATEIKYFEPTEVILKKIVHQEVTDTVISQVDGRINGTKDWIRLTYTAEKDAYLANPNPTTLADMRSNLTSYSNSMYLEVLGPLQEEQFAKPGFQVFLTGVGVQISLNQELALLGDTSYATVVSNQAKNYKAVAEATYNSIRQDRQSMIYMKYGKRCDSSSGYPVCGEFYYWKDDYTGQYQEYDPGKNETLDDAQKRCQAAMNDHIAQALVQLNTDLGDPESVMATWGNLISQPIPIALAA